MDMHFNFVADHPEEAVAPRSFRPQQPASEWVIAEIQADLAEEMARRAAPQTDR